PALGVGSLVIGLALQSAVGPVIAGLFLLFEQPFRLGDWLDAGGVRGRVVEVNWRSVHIDTGAGILIMPNSSLAGASFTNLSRTGGTFPVSTDVTFTTDDPPAAVVALLQRVATGLPQRYPGTQPVAVPTGGSGYTVSFEVRGPSQEGDALAQFRMWLWYAARRAGLGLDGDTTDDFVTAVFTIRGTHTGPFQGHEPTGRSFEVRGIQVSKFRDGKIVERWGATDDQGLAQQLQLDD
ncbi:mechanosensitive ion channel, partial [Bacillus sp. S34]|nr:mechanosensitive ion channel [Bacillus sp. S34]